MMTRPSIVAAIGAILLLAGCQSAPESTPRTAPDDAPVMATAETTTETNESPIAIPQPTRARSVLRLLGFSLERRPIECHDLGDGLGDSDVRILIIASIHGDEPAGTPLVERLIDHLHSTPELLRGRRVVIVPRMNPDGLALDSRFNANQVDLNRNLPASNWSAKGRGAMRAGSEPETRVLVDLLDDFKPHHVVSIHQPLRCIDYDGPAAALANAMAAVCELPVRRLGSRPGSLGSFVGVDRDIPIVTVELPGGAERLSDDVLWEKYGAMLLAAVAFDSTT